jgi:hypothetical protein
MAAAKVKLLEWAEALAGRGANGVLTASTYLRDLYRQKYPGSLSSGLPTASIHLPSAGSTSRSRSWLQTGSRRKESSPGSARRHWQACPVRGHL